MRNPTHSEALTAHMYRDSVHPDVAIATYIRFMVSSRTGKLTSTPLYNGKTTHVKTSMT